MRADSTKPEDSTEATPRPRRPRGFAAMDRTLVREIARKGGKAAHVAGTAHEFTTEEARAAGRKGASVTNEKRLAAAQTAPSPSMHLVHGVPARSSDRTER